MLSESVKSINPFTSEGLNPCFSGICSLSPDKIVVAQEVSVLILVLVEYAL